MNARYGPPTSNGQLVPNASPSKEIAVLRDIAHRINAWAHRIWTAHEDRARMRREQRWITAHRHELLCADDLHQAGAYRWMVDAMFQTCPWIIPWERRHGCLAQSRVYILLAAMRRLRDPRVQAAWLPDNHAMAMHYMDVRYSLAQYLAVAAKERWGNDAYTVGMHTAFDALAHGLYEPSLVDPRTVRMLYE